MKVHVRPAGTQDIEGLIPLLSRGFDGPWPPENWRPLFEQAGTISQPNLGFVLESNHALVGFLGTVCSERHVGGRIERFCNLSSWYTTPEFRSSSILLLMAVLSQPNYTFTTLTPSQTSTQVVKALGFRTLESHKVMCSPFLYRALVEKKRELRAGGRFYKGRRVLEVLLEAAVVKSMELMYWDWSPEVDHRGIRLLTGTERVRPLLSETDRRLLDDHPQCGHFLVLGETSYSYLVTKNRRVSFGRRSRVEFLITDVLHLSQSQPALQHWHSLCRFIASRERSQAVLADERFFGGRPPSGLQLPYFSYFMSRSGIHSDQIDSLYTEIALLDMLFHVWKQS